MVHVTTLSEIERLEVDLRSEDLKVADRTNEQSVDPAAVGNNEEILAHDLAGKIVLVIEPQSSDRKFGHQPHDTVEDEILLIIQTVVVGSVDSDDLHSVEGVELVSNVVDEVQKLLAIMDALRDDAVLADLSNGSRQGGREVETRLATFRSCSRDFTQKESIEVSHGC